MGLKWNFQEGENVIDKDTEQWVDEQNKFWKKKRKEEKEKHKKKVYPESLSPKLL